jgi:hypothetical protein
MSLQTNLISFLNRNQCIALNYFNFVSLSVYFKTI